MDKEGKTMGEFKFLIGNIQYILSKVSPKPVGVKDEFALSKIGQLSDPMTQAQDVLMKKPFQRYNEAVAFVMCQFIDEKLKPMDKPDALIGKYKRYIDMINKV